MPPKRPFYTTFAWAYDLIIDAPAKSRCDFLDRILSRKKLIGLLSILDAGCGTGSYALELASRGHNVIGVDSSLAQLEQARSKADLAGNQLELIQVDLLSLPFEDQFDLVLCRGVLNDFVDNHSRSQIFSQFRKVLKDGGLLIFDVRDWEGSVRQKRKEPETIKELSTDRGQLRFVSRTRLDTENHCLNIREQHTLEGSNGKESHEWDLTMRCWSVIEIADALRLAGLMQVKQYGGFDESLAVGTTERIVTVAGSISS